MGNTNHKNSKLKIYIDTDHEFYNSGSVINGAIFVEALEAFEYDALFIRIEGDEFCEWYEGSSKNRRKFVGNQNFYVQEEMLQRYENKIEQGKYMYPFSIELSENIPGSYISDEYEARIQYKLMAYMVNYNDPKKKHIQEIPLMIREPFRQEVAEYEGRSVTNPVLWCCSSQGEVSIKVHFKTNVCFEDQAVPIQIQCDNSQGKKAVNKFIVELVQYTFLSANNGVSRTYRKVINGNNIYTKVLPGQQNNEIRHQFLIKAPRSSPVQQTAISTLVANYFRIEVYADLASISKDEPFVTSPIFIMKQIYDNGKPKKKEIDQNINMNDFNKRAKHQHFSAPEYWFRKNKNLNVMNFRLEDGVGGEEVSYDD